MAITQEQANQLTAAYNAAQPSGDFSGLQSLVSQYGVTGADVQQYYPGFDVATHAPGVTLASGPQALTPREPSVGVLAGSTPPERASSSSVVSGSLAPSPLGPNISFSTQPMYGTAGDVSPYVIDQFIGANINDPQAIRDAMARTGITQQDLERMYAGTAYTPASIGSYLALPDTVGTVKDLYEKIGFTNAEDPNYKAGIDYWAGRLRSGELTPETFEKEFLTAASGITDPNYATYVANAQNLANEYTGLMSLINADVSDPVKLIRELESRGVTPEQVLAAQQYTSGANAPTLDAINQYWEQGRSGFESRYGDMLSTTFGDETRREALADAYALNTGQDPSKIDFADLIDPTQMSGKSLEAIQDAFRSSDLNNFQTAARVADMATNLFDVDRDTAIALRQDLWKEGKTDNELANKVYDEYAKNGKLSNETYTELMQTAAEMNPNAAIFQQNPELYAKYSPLGERTEVNQGAGQYGYYNNAPILDAREVDKVLSGNNLALDFRSGRTDDNAMGWDLNSRDAGSIKRGVAIFGVTTDPNQLKAINDLEKSLANLGQVKYVEPSGDEGGYYVAEKIKTDSEGNQYVAKEPINSTTYEQLLDNQSKLEAAAAKAGVDPSKYDNFQDLYDAVQDKTKDFYQVTGRTSGWDPDVAAATGIQTLTSAAGDMNHASVLYRREGDKLIAVQDPKIFTANDKKRSGFGAQVAPWAMPLAIMTLPFGGVGGAITQGLGALAGTAMPAWLSAALPTLINTGYSTAMGGGDWNDFGRNLLTANITKSLSSTFTQGLAGLDLGLDASQVKGLSDLAAGALTTLAREGDVGEFVKNQGISTLINEGIDQVGKSLGLDTSSMSREDKIIMASILPAVVSGNFDQGTIMSLAAKLAKERSAGALESSKGTK